MSEKDEAKLAEEEESHELATEPIPGLVSRYSVLTLRGMAAQIVMVVLEGFIMGTGLGAHGLACVGVIMSVEYINLAFGNLYGTGVPSVVGNLLGAGDEKGAQKAFSQSFWLTLYTSLIIAVCFELFTPQLATFFGATPDILEDSVAGIRTFGILLPFTIMGQMVTAVMRVDERPKESGNIMMVAAIVAAVWLALSTFVFKFGVAGAGIYYGLSIGLFSLGLYYFFGGRSKLVIKVEDAKLDWKICGQMIKVGAPFFLIQLGTFVYNTVVNNLLGMFGGADASLYIAAFAVINGYVIYIIMMVAESFAYGMQPVAAFNAGAKAWERLKQTIKSALKLEIVSVIALTVVIWLAAYPICGFFAGGDPVLTPIAADATRIAILASCLGFTSMMMSIYFQAVEKIVLSTILGISRYVIFSCPLMYLMGSAMGINGMWWALVVADICTGVLCLGCAAREIHRLTKIEEQEQQAA
jgi:Na+-driven multidrug efflux pump